MDAELKDAYLKVAEKKRGPVTVLFGEECDEVAQNAILNDRFNKKCEDGGYGCYITDQQGGTGTDFLSHPDIEDKGGVRVVVCVKPESYS